MKKFNEPEALNGVADFHRLFNMPILDTPQIPDEKRCELRVALLQEELDEFRTAILEKDLTEVADALADLQYVLSGAILEFGLGEIFADIFAEVQRSNMSKACESMEEAEQTLDYYRRERNTEGEIKPSGDQFLVYRKNDQKVLKSVNYSPANIDRIVQARLK
jgi:predicted HAD superfamily Cof-like phosphohydrolase